MRLIALILWLTFFSGVATGFFFDRWLHRPITLDIGQHIGQVENRAEGRAPIPCYSDKSENCPSDPGPLNESPRGVEKQLEYRPVTGPASPDGLTVGGGLSTTKLSEQWQSYPGPLLRVKCQERT